jgi:arginase
MTTTPAPRPIALIGAPTDIGAGHRGASMGPEALRVAGLAEALRDRGLTVLDKGNLSGPVNPWLPPVDGYRHINEVVAWNRTVMDAVQASLKAGELPVLLGGDHCLGVGSITAVARHEVTPSGNVHGMPVACLCGVGPEALTGLGGSTPAMDPADIRQIGIRSVDAGEKRLVKEHGLDIYDMRYIDEIGMKRAMEEALEGVDTNTHVHVSFDVDFLDPSIAPGVGTTVPGGPNYREAQLVMEMIADTGRVGSIDIVELNPAFDEHNKTAILAVDLVESLFGKSTLMRD